MSNLNPYPQGQKSETSAESILEWVETQEERYLLGFENANLGAEANTLQAFAFRKVADDIRRRIAAEAEKKAKAFTGGTEL